jgi:hypothetical protein
MNSFTPLLLYARYPLDMRLGKKRNRYKILVVKPEERSPFGRPKHRWGIL